jgi:hypothetical protein
VRYAAVPRPLLPCLLLLACSGLDHGVFVKDHLRYRVAAPTGPGWRLASMQDNDLAWVSSDDGEMLAMNATCADHGDPSLEVLTSHLLLGFTDREQEEQRTETVDGREALRSRYRARLDGVPVDLELLVLKKNGCVHDFTFVAPLGLRAVHRAAFDALVAGFKQETAP